MSSETKQYDIFISYSRQDEGFVRQLTEKLDAWGYAYWIDVTGIESGDVFKKNIVNAIKASKVLLFVSSKASNESSWTIKEVNYALHNKKPIIPIRIDETEYNEVLQFDLDVLDYVDCTERLKREDGFGRLNRALCKYFPDHDIPSLSLEDKVNDSISSKKMNRSKLVLVGLGCLLVACIVCGVIVYTIHDVSQNESSTTAPTAADESELIVYSYDWNSMTASVHVVMYRADLTSIKIPERVTHENKEFTVTGIEDNAFDACFYLTSVTIPESITYIEEYAFRNCRSLTKVTIPKNVTKIGKDAFPAACKLTYEGDSTIYSNALLKEKSTEVKTIRLMNDNNKQDSDAKLMLSNPGRYLEMRIGDGNIFYIYNSTKEDEMCDVGEKKLSEIDVVPQDGWSRNYAVQQGHGYIVRWLNYDAEHKYEYGEGFRYMKLYIVNLIKNNRGEVTEAELEYCDWNVK